MVFIAYWCGIITVLRADVLFPVKLKIV